RRALRKRRQATNKARHIFIRNLCDATLLTPRKRLHGHPLPQGGSRKWIIRVRRRQGLRKRLHGRRPDPEAIHETGERDLWVVRHHIATLRSPRKSVRNHVTGASVTTWSDIPIAVPLPPPEYH